jgi:hypothetical protein
MKKKQMVGFRGSRLSEKQTVTSEELRCVVGGEVGPGGNGTTTDPAASDTRPPSR